jgi:hypothetical protein
VFPQGFALFAPSACQLPASAMTAPAIWAVRVAISRGGEGRPCSSHQVMQWTSIAEIMVGTSEGRAVLSKCSVTISARLARIRSANHGLPRPGPRVRLGQVRAHRDDLNKLARHVERGELRPIVDRVYRS